MTAHIKDGRLVLTGPGTFLVSRPVDEKIYVEDGKSRTRKLADDYIVGSVVEASPGNFTVTLGPDTGEDADAALKALADDPAGYKIYRKISTKKGVTLHRDEGPVKFHSKDQDQAGIGAGKVKDVA